MLHRGEGRTRAIHAVAGLEQRLIVGLAVVGDQNIEGLQIRRQTLQEAGLFTELAHEKLAY